MRILHIGLLASGSLAALITTGAMSGAVAQTSTEIGSTGADEGPNLIVTGSRIKARGYDAPTPTTIIGTEEIARSAQTNIFSAVTQLPSLMGSTGTTVGNVTTGNGNTGLSSFSIHGLGAIRTLTLIDGQRVVPAFPTGVADISQFPQLLIERVDVVTGGASASYGSDAVAGVVNFVTNKNFQGFKANFMGGLSDYNDNETMMVQMAAGHNFLDNRLHIQVSGEYSKERGVGGGNLGVDCDAGPSGRCWFKQTTMLQRSIAGTPAGEPQILVRDYAQNQQLFPYGIITSGPLTGTVFGADGQTHQLDRGSPLIGVWAVGGDMSGAMGQGATLVAPTERKTLYTRIGYDLTPDISVWGTMMLGQVDTSNRPVAHDYRPGNLMIQCDNAFLPQSVRDGCAANGIDNFMMGTINAFLPHQNVVNRRRMSRFVAGVDGKFDLFGNRWSWDAYFQHGVTRSKVRVDNMYISSRALAAIDAVELNGEIVCRSAVARDHGCVPMNIFGNHPDQGTAFNYIFDTPTQDIHQSQDAASIGVSGEAFSNWAGPVSVAAGFEWRREAYTVVGDPLSAGGVFDDPLLNPAGNNYYAGNFRSGGGKYNVREFYLELAVPLFDSDAIGKADLSLAGRATRYSTSGSVGTWKAGLTWDTPIEGLKIRTLKSRDIRAPNLGELFAAERVVIRTINNTMAGGAQATVRAFERGNPDLKPEISMNTQFGVVFQPPWLRGFRMSVDYYHVSVKNMIGLLSHQQIVDLCAMGNAAQCAAIVTNPASGDPATTPIESIASQSFNLARDKTAGFDIEASYQFDALGGDVILQGLATHVLYYKTNSGLPGQPVWDLAGVNAGGAFGTISGNTPNWKLLTTQSFKRDRWSLSLTERWISKGKLSANFIECQTDCPAPTILNPTIDNNRMKSAFYVDLGGTYDVAEGVQAYFKIDNLFNRDPAVVPGIGGPGQRFSPTLYDIVGRMYRAGVRLSF
ncbi:MAG: TonB-dependent receptor [Sphingobium sp.]